MTIQRAIETRFIRQGVADDADTLRRVFEYAGHGLAQTFWRKAHEKGTDFDSMVRERMAKRIGDPVNRFRVCDIDGVPAGGILSYEKTGEPEDPGDAGPMLRVLIEAENNLVGTHYINALAVFPEFRKRGIAEVLIRDSAGDARQPLSLIAADENTEALRLYRRLGFEDISHHPIRAEGWTPNGRTWITMIRAN